MSIRQLISKVLSRIRYWGEKDLTLFLESIPESSHISRKNLTIDGIPNLSVGPDVYIGPNALIYCTSSKVIIKHKVVIGPGLTIVAGDHNYTTIGKFIIDERNNLKDNNLDVVIEPDVWIGANVTILKGVTIGRGCVIAACTCVTKSVPPYSIVAGVPGKVMRKRFTESEIAEHERILYKE